VSCAVGQIVVAQAIKFLLQMVKLRLHRLEPSDYGFALTCGGFRYKTYVVVDALDADARLASDRLNLIVVAVVVVSHALWTTVTSPRPIAKRQSRA
jgi:hypothetical protein